MREFVGERRVPKGARTANAPQVRSSSAVPKSTPSSVAIAREPSFSTFMMGSYPVESAMMCAVPVTVSVRVVSFYVAFEDGVTTDAGNASRKTQRSIGSMTLLGMPRNGKSTRPCSDLCERSSGSLCLLNPAIAHPIDELCARPCSAFRFPILYQPFAFGELPVGVGHHLGQAFECDLRLPAEVFARLGGVAEEEVDFRRAGGGGGDFDLFFSLGG